MKLSSSTFLLAIVLLYSVIAAAIFPATFLPLLIRNYAPNVLFGAPILAFFIFPLAALGTRAPSPVRYFKETIARDWLEAVIIIVTFWLFMSAFTTFKARLVPSFGFYADPLIANADRMLFGEKPWRLAHRSISTSLDFPLAICYGKLWFLNFLGTVVFVSLFRGGAERLRYLYAFVLVWVLLGTVMATLLSSAGPVFFDRIHGAQRFAALAEWAKTDQLAAVIAEEVEYLHRAYVTGNYGTGTGISAMPSIHVALVVLNAIFFSSLSLVFGLLMWAFAAVIVIGSVYTGFHYAFDAIASLILVPIIWKLASKLTVEVPEQG